MSETMIEVKSEVFNEDCMVGMSRYPDKYFELAEMAKQNQQVHTGGIKAMNLKDGIMKYQALNILQSYFGYQKIK